MRSLALILTIAAGAQAQAPIAFTHVSVVDATSPTPRTDQTIIVRGNRVAGVGPTATLRVPSNARVIDARGKYMIPGLWDMHVHTSVVAGRRLLELFVANGVTGIRDMAGDWDTLTTWRREIKRGTLTGPRIVASGPYLEGGDVPIPHILTRTPEEGRAAVDSLARLGVDFIKVHGQLQPATYYAIARRAREKKMVFAGHVSQAVGAANASDSGQKSIEHMLAIPAPCTVADSVALRPRFSVQGAIGRCSTRDLAPLYARFVKNRTWVTPTFTAAVEIATWPQHDVPGDTLAHYLPQEVVDLAKQIFPMPDSIPPGADSVGKAMLAIRLAQAESMRRAGVHIMTGTDSPLRNSPPGFGLHEELLLLTRGGMSPFHALRSATYEPAAYLNMLDSAGTIEPGKLADLVLLDANPLVNITNTRLIRGVVANGRWYDDRARKALVAPR
jgi:imidazolonepropionase-like amidohydrolase